MKDLAKMDDDDLLEELLLQSYKVAQGLPSALEKIKDEIKQRMKGGFSYD
ncbi:hypothetical protein [Paenibacillus chitinolyticus]